MINKSYKSIVCHPDLRNKFKKKSTIDSADCINEAVLLANSLGIKVQFSKIYKVKEKELLALNAIRSSRALKSPFELFYKIKGILRYYRNVFREKIFKNKKQKII